MGKKETKQAPVDFTPENAIKAVAREHPHLGELTAEEQGLGSILVYEKRQDYYKHHNGVEVLTKEAATAKQLLFLKEVLAGGDLCDHFEEKELFKILAVLIDPSELRHWVIARTCQHVRSQALGDLNYFWKLWRKSELKPTYVEHKKLRSKQDREANGETVYPSFELIKDLQDHVVNENLKSTDTIFACVRHFGEDEEEGASGVLLDQCHVDPDMLVRALFDKSGGLKNITFGKLTREGFFICHI